MRYGLSDRADISFDGRVTDALIGQVGLHHARNQASLELLASSDGGYWYWDGDDDSEVSCSGPTPPDVPRCSDFVMGGRIGTHSMPDGEPLQVVELDWLRHNGVGASREDAMSPKGRVDSLQGDYLRVGQVPARAFIQQISDELVDQDLNGYGGHALVGYDWSKTR